MADRCGFRWSAPYLNPDGGITSLVQVCCLAADHDGDHESSTKVIADNPFSPVSRHARDGETRDRRFPILDGEDIPWRAIARHEDIAKANHGGQDLEHLASRGGLSVREAIHVIERRRWRGPESDAIVQLSDAAAADRLRGLLSERDGETLSNEQWNDLLRRHAEFNDSLADIPPLIATVAALRAQLAEARADKEQWDDLRFAGAMLSNVAYNLKQTSYVPDDVRATLVECVERWDRAARAASGEDASNEQAGRARQETE